MSLVLGELVLFASAFNRLGYSAAAAWGCLGRVGVPVTAVFYVFITLDKVLLLVVCYCCTLKVLRPRMYDQLQGTEAPYSMHSFCQGSRRVGMHSWHDACLTCTGLALR